MAVVNAFPIDVLISLAWAKRSACGQGHYKVIDYDNYSYRRFGNQGILKCSSSGVEVLEVLEYQGRNPTNGESYWGKYSDQPSSPNTLKALMNQRTLKSRPLRDDGSKSVENGRLKGLNGRKDCSAVTFTKSSSRLQMPKS